ncbi:MAG: ABC transporter permease subunit [Thermodesulfobacteriota bacterium]|nr:ABC transporter permease subunit [Thermodesulfobacteriota bacterium]
MRNILTIFQKEFKSYFNSPIAYIFIITFILFSSWLFFRTFFLIGQAHLRPLFSIFPWLFLILAPSITMRAWAEEKKMGTIEVLMTLPLKDYEVVVGKFLASFFFMITTVVLTFPLAVTVYSLGNPDTGSIIGGYIGAILMGGAYLAIGLFCSSLTKNQIVAFIISTVSCFILLIIGEDIVLMSAPDTVAPLFSYLGLGTHFESISRGVIDSRDLIYYFSTIGFFLFLNTLALESRKWK